MKRKKAIDVIETKGTATMTVNAATEGVIDLNPPMTECEAGQGCGQLPVGFTPGQKPKRKYTRRAKQNNSIPDYQQRVIAELEELNERRVKLSAFLNSLPSNNEIQRLTKQLAKMTEYADILKERIDNFGKLEGGIK